MGRTVKRLTGLEIDEVSTVDRPANQYGLVAIAKNYQEDDMAVFDEQGNEVFEEELQPGMTVYGEDGAEYVFVEGDAGEYQPEDADQGAEEQELVGVGKGFSLAPAAGAAQRGAVKGAAFAGRNRKVIGAGAAGAAGGFAAGRVGKSFGQTVLSQLSKALSDDDRDQVIAKALDQVEIVAKRNEALEETVAALLEERDLADFGSIAKSYGLPGDDDELAGVLYRAAQTLPPEDVAVLDRLFTGAGEVGKALYTEIGYSGASESDALSQIFAMAGEAVVKNDLGLTQEQAVTALFAANPSAYDQYELEQNQR